jgi:hypothetical protein
MLLRSLEHSPNEASLSRFCRLQSMNLGWLFATSIFSPFLSLILAQRKIGSSITHQPTSESESHESESESHKYEADVKNDTGKCKALEIRPNLFFSLHDDDDQCLGTPAAKKVGRRSAATGEISIPLKGWCSRRRR